MKREHFSKWSVLNLIVLRPFFHFILQVWLHSWQQPQLEFMLNLSSRQNNEVSVRGLLNCQTARKEKNKHILYMYWKREYECHGTVSEEIIFTPTYSALITFGYWLTGSQFFTPKNVWGRCVKHHSTWNPSPYCTRVGWYPRREAMFSLRGRL